MARTMTPYARFGLYPTGDGYKTPMNLWVSGYQLQIPNFNLDIITDITLINDLSISVFNMTSSTQSNTIEIYLPNGGSNFSNFILYKSINFTIAANSLQTIRVNNSAGSINKAHFKENNGVQFMFYIKFRTEVNNLIFDHQPNNGPVNISFSFSVPEKGEKIKADDLLHYNNYLTFTREPYIQQYTSISASSNLSASTYIPINRSNHEWPQQVGVAGGKITLDQYMQTLADKNARSFW